MHLWQAIPPPPSLVADSGLRGHYTSIEASNIGRHIATFPIIVTMTDDNTATYTRTYLLDPPSLPPKAHEGDIFPQFTFGTLILSGVLYNHGWITELDVTSIYTNLHDKVSLHGTRLPATQLWCIDTPTSPTEPPHRKIAGSPGSANAAIRHTPYVAIIDCITFLHSTMCFLAILTLCDEIDAGYLSSFPEITSALVQKYPPHATAVV